MSGAPVAPGDASGAPSAGAGAESARWLRGRLRRFFSGILQAGVFTALSVVLWWLCAWLLHSTPWIEHELLLTPLSLLPAVMISTSFLLLLGERKSYAAVGLSCNRLAVKQLGLGLALGGGLSLSIVAVQWLGGWVDIVHGAVWAAAPGAPEPALLWAPSFGVGLLVLASGAAGEEMLFRGYGFQQLMRATHPWVAVGGSAIVFGVMHGSNPQFSRISLVNTVLFGLLFGLALVRHRSLWLPFGMHFGWNFSLAAVGANVSGLRIRLTSLEIVPTGPTVWTGGAYGPEASVLATFGVVAAAWILWQAPLRASATPVLWDQ